MAALAIFASAYVLSQFFRTFLAIVAADLARDPGFGPADLGNLSAIWFAAFALAQLPIGWCLDRFGPRRTTFAFMLAAGAGSLLFARADGFALAGVGMALIGVGCAPVLMGAMYVVGRTLPAERFALAGSLLLGVASLGNILGTTPLALAAAAWGWRVTFVAIAGLVAIIAVMLVAIVRDPPRVPAPTTADGGSRFVGSARFRALLLMLPLIFASYAVVIAERALWVGPFLETVHGLAPLDRANVAFIMALAMTVGAFAYAPLERWLGGAKRAVAIGTAITAASFVVLALPIGASVARDAALLALVGCFGLTYAPLLGHGRRFLPDHLLGRGVTGLNTVFIGGAAIVQLGSGYAVEAAYAAGATPTTVHAGLHIAFAGLLLVGLLVYLAAPERPRD